MNISKFVAPNTVFDSSVSFLRNTTFDSSVYLQGVTFISDPSISVATTPYALVVETIGTDIQVKAIQLGTMAFTQAADWDASLNNLESSIGALDLLTQQHTTDIADISTRITGFSIADISARIYNAETSINRIDGSINFLWSWDLAKDASIIQLRSDIADLSTRTDTRLDNHDTSIAALDVLTQIHDVSIGALTISINDLSTNKLDAVANINVVGDASLFAYETGTTAYLKKLVAGSDIVITEDTSTITISGAASTVSKYTDSFDPTGITTYVIPGTSTNVTDGYASVAVYENNQLVYPDIDVAANGDITIQWAPGSLSPTVKVVALG